MHHKNCISILCLFLVSLGILLLALKSPLYNYGIRTLLNLEPGSSLFKAWSKSPPGVNFDVYIFNWTNPEDFLNHSTKPILNEVGPFRFKQTIEKVNATKHKNGTLSYYRRRTFVFSREDSVHDLDFNLTIPNPVAMAAAHSAREWNYFSKKAISYTLRTLLENEIHVTKPVGEMLFTGYNDPVLDAIQKFSFLAKGSTRDKFAWFYGKNASASFDGIFNVGTGGLRPLGQIYEWNYQTNTTFYHENCSTFEGSAGDFFPRYRQDETLKLFHSDVCRTLLVDYEGNSKVHGIEGYKYVLGDHALDNGTLIPGNECTCGKNCLPYGVIYATACKENTPNYLSLPHFYKADPYYADKIVGMNPQKEKHDFYIIYEPTTGLPLRMTPRLQLNILMKPVSYIGMYEEIPSLLFPVVWFEQTLGMPSSSAFLVKILLNLKFICLLTGLMLICIGVLVFLFMIYKLRNSNFEHHKSKTYLPKELVPLNEKENPRCLSVDT